MAAANKYPLVGPNANIWCTDLTPYPGEDISQPQPGFVTYRLKDKGETLRTVVHLQEALPDTDYPVRVIQDSEDGADCFTEDGVLRTDAAGNGVLHLSEPVTGTAAQVIIDESVQIGVKAYRGTEVFVFPL